eukprot:Polyplicarium_translucidae@DN2868_c1_g2_i1.p3
MRRGIGTASVMLLKVTHGDAKSAQRAQWRPPSRCLPTPLVDSAQGLDEQVVFRFLPRAPDPPVPRCVHFMSHGAWGTCSLPAHRQPCSDDLRRQGHSPADTHIMGHRAHALGHGALG